jgi:hypothetical protein
LKLLVVLPIVASIFLGFGIYQIFYASKIPSQSFTFTWGPDKQHIVDGELRLEMGFKWIGENLSIVARINATEHPYEGANYLGLVFDTDHNDIISSSDHPYQLFADNVTIDRSVTLLLPSGRITSPCDSLPKPSPYHTCTFDKATGYTFSVNIPRWELRLTKEFSHIFPNITKIKVHVVFEDGWANDAVYVQFDLEVPP